MTMGVWGCEGDSKMAGTSCYVFTVLVWYKYSVTSTNIQIGNERDMAKPKVITKERLVAQKFNLSLQEGYLV